MKKAELFFNAILVPLDYLMFFLAGVAAYYLRVSEIISGWRPVLFELSLTPGEYYRTVFAVALFGVGVFALSGLYKIKKNFRSLQEFFLIVTATSAGLLAVVFYLFLFRQVFESRFIVFAVWLLSIIFVTLGRVIVRIIEKSLLKKYHYGAHRVLIVGNGSLASRLKKEINRRPDLGYVAAGYMPNIEIEKIRSFAQNPGIDEIILTNTDFEKDKILSLTDFCEETRVVFKFVPNLFQSLATNIEFDTISAIPLIEFKKTPLEGWGRIMKRATDLSLSSFGLLLLSPLFLTIAALIKIESRGPVFYKSIRISGGEKFLMYKFRSMVDNAEREKEKLLELNERNDGPLFKMKNDPRVTKLGRLLRKLRLDELPQLINVLRGEMTLVGPRAHLPEEIAQYKHHHKKLLTIKAGATGMAQVSGSSDLSFEEEVRLDTYYLENWSLPLDFKIVLKTVLILFFDRSAC